MDKLEFCEVVDSMLNSVEYLTVFNWDHARLGEHRLNVALDMLFIHIWHNLHPDVTHFDLAKATTSNTLEHEYRNKHELAFSESDTILVGSKNSSMILFQLGQVESRKSHD